MPEKNLTIQIPEPADDGACSSLCPLCDGVTGSCNEGLGIGNWPTKPGPECPQYQTPEASAKRVYDMNIAALKKAGYTETTTFPGEYMLMIHPDTLHKVRVYENGSVWVH
jgi:hypothetical protein